MGVDLRLRLHRLKCLSFLHHLLLETKRRDGRERVVMEDFPEFDFANTNPRVLSLIGVKSLSEPNPEFEVVFQSHPNHTIETLARFSRSRPRRYLLFFNNCRTHSFAVIKHAMMPPPDSEPVGRPKPSIWPRDGFDFWRFDQPNRFSAGRQAEGVDRNLPGALARRRL
jgi:hypothetical protein